MPTATAKEKKSKKPAKAKTTVTKEAGGKGVTVKKADKKAKAKADKAKAEKAKPAKADKAKTDKAAKSGGPSHRQLIFEALAGSATGMARKELREATGLEHVTRILSSEINRTDGDVRVKGEKIEGVSGKTYTLTAAGRKAVKNGTVDSDAPGRA